MSRRKQPLAQLPLDVALLVAKQEAEDDLKKAARACASARMAGKPYSTQRALLVAAAEEFFARERDLLGEPNV